jgi:hypothetical protein
MSNDKLDILTQLRTEREMGYKGGLYHIAQIDFSYNSNHMEGSSLTSDETRYIYETIRHEQEIFEGRYEKFGFPE